MRLRIRLFAAIAGSLLLALTVTACGLAEPTSSPMLCLATDFNTTGPNGALGLSAQNAVDLAVDQASLGGGYTLTTLHYASQTVKQGVVNMTDAANQACTRAFIGPNDDVIAAAEMPIAINAGLPMLSPGLTNPGLTNSTDARYDGINFNAMHPAGKVDTFFRLLAADDSQVGVAATALRQAGAARVYVLDDGQPYGTSVGDFFAAKLSAYGGAVAGNDSVLDTAPTTAAAQVARIVAAKAGGIFYAGNAAMAAAIRQAMTKPLPFVMMSQPATDPTYIEDAGPAADGTLDVTATPDVATLRSADAAQFVASYTQRFGAAPTPLAVSAYDAAEIAIGTLRSIINHGNVPYLVSVLNQVATQQYTGIAGSYWFSTSGDNVQAGPVNIYIVRDGNWALAQSI